MKGLFRFLGTQTANCDPGVGDISPIGSQKGQFFVPYLLLYMRVRPIYKYEQIVNNYKFTKNLDLSIDNYDKS